MNALVLPGWARPTPVGWCAICGDVCLYTAWAAEWAHLGESPRPRRRPLPEVDEVMSVCSGAAVAASADRTEKAMNRGRSRLFQGGPRDGVRESLEGVRASEYVDAAGAPVRASAVSWTPSGGLLEYADVYGRECGSARGARVVVYIWCGSGS